jgi:Ala-tRNA(Pro) deacylase
MIPDNILRFLDEKGVRFRIEEHPLRVTAQEVAHAAHVSGRRFAKTVVLRQAGRGYVLAVLPADEQIDLSRLGGLLGGRVELAREDEFDRLFPGCERGAMPPFGALYRLPVVVDACLARQGAIAFNAGSHTEVIEMAWEDFRQVAEPRVVDYGERAH